MKKVILIVDDEKDVVECISRHLQKGNYEPLIAYDGEEGLNRIKNGGVDAVVLDYAMDGCNGFQFCQRLKESKAFSKIPIVICSAYPSMEKSFRQLGIDDYITKPFDFQTLDQALERIFKRESTDIKYKKILVQTMNTTVGIQAAVREMEEWGCRIDTLVIPEKHNLIEEAFRYQPDVVIFDAAIKNPPPDKLIQALRGYVEFRSLVIIICLNHNQEKVKSRKKKGDPSEDLEGRCIAAGARRCISSLSRDNVLNVLFENCKVGSRG